MLMHPFLDLLGAQLPIGLNDGAFAMQPLRLDRVQPRCLDRQVAHPDLAAPLPLDLAVVCPDPAPHLLDELNGLPRIEMETFAAAVVVFPYNRP
jgi:hypothetical protein